MLNPHNGLGKPLSYFFIKTFLSQSYRGMRRFHVTVSVAVLLLHLIAYL